MADLSTLDPTQPPGTQAASQGDDRIRETRDAVINSFGGPGNAGTGGTQPEHNLNGVHHFKVQGSAFRPAAGNPGRLFFDSDHLRAEFDTGAAWNVLHMVQGIASTVFSGTLVLTTGFQNLTSVATFNAGNNQYMILIGYALWHPAGPGSQAFRTKFIVNGVDAFPGEQLSGSTTSADPSNIQSITLGAAFPLTASGPQIVQFVGKLDSTAGTVTSAVILGFAF